ncbi:uncharacterized protein LOC127844203 [Dreissena polymorpha]|uniref:Polysaccharide lyase 14 domain-containing protein n=1 Tax=Dreissena polymorpha TaxID=45954 RepID=A0A9D4IF20_DREPO|nr:uncharacterized protein LOC127844203 [Dreissena polymorpha]KAH3772986.1 hypothetical protein DPMN_174334 [Dreissena polymorpha]
MALLTHTCLVLWIGFLSTQRINCLNLWTWSHENHNKDIMSVIKDGFHMTNTRGMFGIGANDSLTLAEDPEHPGQWVLRVFYAKGSYSAPGTHRGAQFYGTPSALTHHNYTTLTLEYEVYFPSSFDWNKGGKLPGLFGGTSDCAGGIVKDTCFSTRLMWRALGDGEVYAYVTHSQSPDFQTWCAKYSHASTPAYMHIYCVPGYGIEIAKNTWRFQHNHWHLVRQEIHLNDHPGQNGYIKLWVDRRAEVHVTDVHMRANTNFGIDGLFFSTFFGGGDSTYACPHDTYTYFRNFKIFTDTATPSHSELVG